MSRKISPARKKSLVNLIKLMNVKNTFHLPVTKHLINCFDIAVDPFETEFLLKIGVDENLSFKGLLAISGMKTREFIPFFENILKKGLLASMQPDKPKAEFSLSPILVGWFEIYLSDGSESEEKIEFAKSLDKYFNSMKLLNFFPVRNLINYKYKNNPRLFTQIISPIKQPENKRTIEVNKDLSINPVNIYPFQNIYDLVDKHGADNRIAVIHCFCRQWKKMVGEPCKFKHEGESCIVIGTFTKSIVKLGIGRNISKDEALTIIDEAQKKGAIHQVFHEHEDLNLPEMAICNCCWDCCGILSGYNRGLTPLALKANFIAEIINSEFCTGCRKCKKYCPVDAIEFKDNLVVINNEKCIGCGQCELKCSEKVIKMSINERDVILPMIKKSKARIK